MIFSLRNLGLTFSDDGAKLCSPVLAFDAVLGYTVQYVAYRYVSGIAATFKKAVPFERFINPVSVCLDDVGKLTFRLIVIAENMVEVFADVRG